ncbi:MAG: ABC transporter permease [Mycobacterium sp.]
MTDQRNDGAAPGFSSRRTLRVSVEIARQLSRPSIRTVLVAVAILPCALAASLVNGKFDVSFSSHYLSGIATQSGANFLVFALFVGSQLAIALLVAYVFGEAVTREAQWSYLPVLLTTPVRRGQFLRQKAIACSVVCLIGLAIFAGVSAVVGFASFGAGPLAPVSGPHIPLGQMWWRFAVMLGYIACYLSWVGALALLLSVLAGNNSVIAVGGTVAITLLSHLFGGLPTFGLVRGFLPSRNFDAWTVLANADVDWLRVQWGVFLSLLYAGCFGLLAYGVFAERDIHSG